MKWPNLGQTLENLRQRDEDFTLDTISSDAFAYFSGLVVPGVSISLPSFLSGLVKKRGGFIFLWVAT